jgi:hypothetical protein
MFFAASSNSNISNPRLKPSAVWNINRSLQPDLFNHLHNWWSNNLTQTASCKVRIRVVKALISGKMPIYLKGVIEDNNGIQNIVYIIHGGGELSEKKLWMMPVTMLQTSCVFIGGAGTPATTVELFR